MADDRADRDPTLAYYEASAVRYAEETLGVDLSAPRAVFLARVPAGGRLLDAGCGSGRDAAAFLAAGYQVDATDASPALAAEAGRRIGRPVLVVRHEEAASLLPVAAYDGVWASATFLHVPRESLPLVFAQYRRVLAPAGTLYASFRRGETDGPDPAGRHFTNFTADALERFGRGLRGYRFVAVHQFPDGTRPDVTWLGLVLEAA